MSDQHLYSDSGFWQGVVAFIALILTQCPPVRLWLKRAKLDIESFDRIALNEEVGLPNAQLHLTITNTGGRDVRIKKVSVEFIRGTDHRHVDARGYFEKITDQQATLFTPFRLKPKEEWSHNVSFFKFAPREDRQAFSALAKGLKDNITTKRATLPEKSPDVEGDPGVVQPILGMFDANFFWRAGEYQIELHVETDSAKANTKRFFRFTLFESDSDQLKAHRDQLKFGNGVYFRLPPVEPTFVELHQIN